MEGNNKNEQGQIILIKHKKFYFEGHVFFLLKKKTDKL